MSAPVTHTDRELTSLHPKLVLAWLLVRDTAARGGYPIFLVEGRRSNERQDWLYAQGRTRPGDIVTHAKAGESNHNPKADGFGHALDFAFQGSEPFDDRHPWERVGLDAEKRGLLWGGRWPEKKRDRPHLELPPQEGADG